MSPTDYLGAILGDCHSGSYEGCGEAALDQGTADGNALLHATRQLGPTTRLETTKADLN